MSQMMGKIKEVDKFDGLFFGIMAAMGDTIDPQSRILLETTYEAIMDAGMCSWPIDF
jgi:fatty acid synthase